MQTDVLVRNIFRDLGPESTGFWRPVHGQIRKFGIIWWGGEHDPFSDTQDDMTMRTRKIALVALLALLASPAASSGGQYHVYSCRTPSGVSAPVDGWSGSVAKGSAYDVVREEYVL